MKSGRIRTTISLEMVLLWFDMEVSTVWDVISFTPVGVATAIFEEMPMRFRAVAALCEITVISAPESCMNMRGISLPFFGFFA